MNVKSRENNGIHVKTYPVKIKDFQRGWFLPIPKDETTALSLIRKNSCLTNGLLLEVSNIDIELMDKREKEHGYERVRIEFQDIEFINPNLEIEDESVIWTYITHTPRFPTENNPITQSYVDVIVQGCIEQGEDFASEFVNTTEGWDKPWINDREKPRYRRFLDDIDYRGIDKILNRVINHRKEIP